MSRFSSNGVIGKSGKFYPCKLGGHIKTMLANDDAPFVEIKSAECVVFEAYYTADKIKPTRAQFETLMNWCTAMHERFEDVTDCWNLPWQDYKS
jgi:hypothetical protein